MCKKTLFAILFSPLLLSAQTELIQNGNFSIPNGSSGAAWVIDNSQGSGYFNFGTTTANMFNSASGYAYSASNVPGPQTNMYQYLKQDNVIVPINASSATFSFYTSAFVQSPATGNEKLFAYIYDVTLNQITSCTTTITFSSGASPGNANGYSQYSLSLPSTHFGHSLQIGFRAQSGSSPATIRVDDVSLTYIAPSCTPPITPISFTANPSIITAGQPTTLTINGGSLGSAPYWQIYANNNCTGTPVDFTSGNATTIYPNSTTYYYVNATGCGTSTNCLNAIVTVNASCIVPTVTSPTLNATNAGNSTSCSVTASGSPTSFTYNWQVNTGGGWISLSNNGNTTWSTGGSTSTLTLSNTSLSMNGYQYRCIVSNGCTPDATSSATTLSVTNICAPISNLNITGNQTVTAPAQATFTATASGTSPQYQWQYSTDNGNTYNIVPASSPYSGTTTNQLVISPTSQMQTGKYYRCQISNSCTNPAQNTVGKFLTVYTTQPNPIVNVSQPQTGGNITLYTTTNLIAYLNVVCDSVQFSVSYNGLSGTYNYISTFISSGTSAFQNWTPSYITSSNCVLRARAYKNGIGYDGYSGVFNISQSTNGNSIYSFGMGSDNKFHLFWPFEFSQWSYNKFDPLRNGWIRIGEIKQYPIDCPFSLSGDCDYGTALHQNGDYFSQDWNQKSGSSDIDCGKVFRSPLSGTVIGFYSSCHNSSPCVYQTTDNCQASNHVFIKSDIYPDFVFGVIHLQDVSFSVTTIGQHVNVGDAIGLVGASHVTISNNPDIAHAHCVVYKIAQQYSSQILNYLATPTVDGFNSAGVVANSSKQEFVFDASVNGSGGSQATNLIFVNGNTLLCPYDSVVLSAQQGSAYHWNIGDTTQSIIVHTAGNYSVLITDQQNNQLISQTITVKSDTTIAIKIVPDNPVLCQGSQLTLKAGELQNGQVNVFNFTLPNQFNWSNGSTTNITAITLPGVYYLTYTDGQCIHAVDSITIQSSPPPQQPTINNTFGNLASTTISGCTYQWFLNGNVVGDGQYLKADTIGSGYYTVQATNQNGCSSLSNPVYVQTTGMSDLYGENVFIYPNPATNLLNIKLLGNLEKGKYEIQNSLGQSILQGDLNNSGINSVDISRLVSGVYFIQLTNGSTKYNSRFLKE
jgi:hypothetical protein